jgi:AcrR family transcriptional regulator
MPDGSSTSTTPRTPRAERTRAALVKAAREVFERDGFVDARITDIAEAGGVAHGSFYTHFASKDAAFAAVLAEVQEEMLHPQMDAADAGDDPVRAVEAANRAYLEGYRHNARLMGLLEQVATTNEEFRRLRRRRADAFVQRNARTIRRLQRQGLADRALDPNVAAIAVSSMVSRTAYTLFVIDQAEVDLDALIATLTRLWTNALRMPSGDKD